MGDFVFLVLGLDEVEQHSHQTNTFDAKNEVHLADRSELELLRVSTAVLA